MTSKPQAATILALETAGSDSRDRAYSSFVFAIFAAYILLASALFYFRGVGFISHNVQVSRGFFMRRSDPHG